jgi:PAS domain-containing protein
VDGRRDGRRAEPPGGLLALAERRRALTAAGRWRGMVPIRRSDGARVEVDAECTTLRGEDGERVGYVSVQRRVGERARAVADLRRAEEELRRRSEQAPPGYLARLSRREPTMAFNCTCAGSPTTPSTRRRSGGWHGSY